MAQVVKQQLLEIGLNITLRPVDTATFTRLVFTERSHTVAFGVGSPAVSTNGDLYITHHSMGTQNRSNLNDPQLDAMIDRQASMVRDVEGRKRLLLEIQRYVINNAHLIPVYGVYEERVRWKHVRDWAVTPLMHEPFVAMWIDK
jgi:ABC-type transport system substrate-binding protein